MLSFDGYFMINGHCFSVQKWKNEHKKDRKCAEERYNDSTTNTETEREKGWRGIGAIVQLAAGTVLSSEPAMQKGQCSSFAPCSSCICAAPSFCIVTAYVLRSFVPLLPLPLTNPSHALFLNFINIYI